MNLKPFVLTFAIALSSFFAVAQDFTQSELPIVVINTEEDIPDEPKFWVPWVSFMEAKEF